MGKRKCSRCGKVYSDEYDGCPYCNGAKRKQEGHMDSLRRVMGC